jgi:hypothetical protein
MNVDRGQPQFAQSPFCVPKNRLRATNQGAHLSPRLSRKPEVDPAFHFQSRTANKGLRLNHFPGSGFSLVLVTFVYRSFPGMRIGSGEPAIKAACAVAD